MNKEEIMEMLSDFSKQESDSKTYEQRAIPDYNFDELTEVLIKKFNKTKDIQKHPIIEAFVKWQQENPDEDYQYDEIHEFFTDLTRGQMLNFMKLIAS